MICGWAAKRWAAVALLAALKPFVAAESPRESIAL